MAKKRTASQKIKRTPEQNLTPEQQRQMEQEQQMLDFIKREGIGPMVELQVEGKKNDSKAKQEAQSNIQAYFETMGEIADMRTKGLINYENVSEIATEYNDFKVSLYDTIIAIYDTITPDMFGLKEEEFVNPFSEAWETYKNKRETPGEALRELYAWTIFQDPVLWAAGLNRLCLQHKVNEEWGKDSEPSKGEVEQAD